MPYVQGRLGLLYQPEINVPDMVKPALTMVELARQNRTAALQEQQVRNQTQAMQSLQMHRQREIAQKRVADVISLIGKDPQAAEKMVNNDPELRTIFGTPDGVKFAGKKGSAKLFRNLRTGDVYGFDLTADTPEGRFFKAGNIGAQPLRPAANKPDPYYMKAVDAVTKDPSNIGKSPEELGKLIASTYATIKSGVPGGGGGAAVSPPAGGTPDLQEYDMLLQQFGEEALSAAGIEPPNGGQ